MTRQSDLTSPADVVADGLMTIPDAAQFLCVSKSKLYELMDGGELEFVKLGRSRRIPRRALVELAASNLQGGWRQ
jgi:excisionase family DNA binding protein